MDITIAELYEKYKKVMTLQRQPVKSFEEFVEGTDKTYEYMGGVVSRAEFLNGASDIYDNELKRMGE